jgi:hypothetical protein
LVRRLPGFLEFKCFNTISIFIGGRVYSTSELEICAPHYGAQRLAGKNGALWGATMGILEIADLGFKI